MKNKSFIILSFVLVVAVFSACEKNPNADRELLASTPSLPANAFNYAEPSFPSHVRPGFPELNNDVATLGRVLFYDKQLSINNAISCSGCHNQAMAFADGRQSSNGFINTGTPRNSMHIANVFRQSAFFWDIRENSLQSMVLKPIQNHVEMGFEKMDYLVEKLNKIEYYDDLFDKAYGNSIVTAERISKALTQFLQSMVTYKSKFDIGKQTNFANFTASELNGYKLFSEKLPCGHCHAEPDFDGWGGSYANIGLDVEYKDKGVDFNRISGNLLRFAPFQNNPDNAMEGFFKVPSLRNVALTGPYMHDGRFNTLEEVIEHYNSGVKDHKNLNWELTTAVDFNKTGGPDGIPIFGDDTNFPGTAGTGKAKHWDLTPQEKADLLAFLNTLTDYNFISDQKFSNPFVASK